MDIIENIKKRSTELTRKQYMVAKYMIDHPDEMAYITLKELSQNIGVTEITILNTCASLGYEGFTQIKYEFRKDIIQKQKTDVLDDSSVYTEKVSKYEHDNREKVLSEIGDEEVKAITDYWQNIDLKKYFDVVIGLDDVKVTKPDPEGIVKAMELLGVKKAVYIGDNITDIQAGKNAGIKTIGVKWSPKGYQHLLELEPDLMIDEMKEIIPYIEGAC